MIRSKAISNLGICWFNHAIIVYIDIIIILLSPKVTSETTEYRMILMMNLSKNQTLTLYLFITLLTYVVVNFTVVTPLLLADGKMAEGDKFNFAHGLPLEGKVTLIMCQTGI